MIADSNGHNASIVNYSLFVSIWGMLTLLYLIPASIKDSFQIHAMIPLVLDVLNVIFWFCGAVALAAELGAHSCGNSVSWPQAASPPFTRPAVADRIITGLPQQQQGHRWLQQALPRGSGLLRLPLVRIRRVRRLDRHVRPRHGWRQQRPRRNPPWPSHEPGINDAIGATRPSRHLALDAVVVCTGRSVDVIWKNGKKCSAVGPASRMLGRVTWPWVSRRRMS
nr:hypothetical protein CFP56_21281 [Quercus suber]